MLSLIWRGKNCSAFDKTTRKRLSGNCYRLGQCGVWTLYMEIMQIWLQIGAVSNPQCSKRSLFTSDCKHCIIFISASHTLLCESKATQRKMPSLSSGNPDTRLSFIYLLFFLSSSCEISEADATLTTEDFSTWISWDGWRSIYITLPGALLPSPSPSPLFLLFNLGNAGERACPKKGIMGI